MNDKRTLLCQLIPTQILFVQWENIFNKAWQFIYAARSSQKFMTLITPTAIGME